MKHLSLKAELRTEFGKKAAKAARREGMVPCNLYGAGENVTFDQVLAVGGETLTVGNPTVAGATVESSVVKEGRGKKVIVYKYKRKTGYHKKTGHRQAFTQVKIEKINA